MPNNDVLRRAVRYALFANAAAAAVVPVAHAADPATPDEAPVTEVIVTGSRISAPGLTSVSPVTSVGQEEIKQQGSTRIEDLLNTLPQVTPDMSGGVSNGATGEATVNLRDLGVQRTLVLINGRRLMPGDPNGPALNGFSAPDLNNIPAALVERIDVLTGGASSTYGADAVAGVVNFVMNDHFEGVQINANGSMNNHHNHSNVQSVVAAAGDPYPTGTSNDGKTKDITVLLGHNFADGKGNFTAYGSYRRVDALLESQRDFSSCSTDPATGGTTLACGGSGTSAFGKFSTLSAGNGNFAVDPAAGFVPYVGSKYNYNYAPTNYFQRPDERWTAGEFMHYDVTDKVQAYSEFMFMEDRSTAQLAPGGAFFGSGQAVDPTTGIPNGATNVNCANPLMSAAEIAAICNGATTGLAQIVLGRRNVEGGTRDSELDHTAFRLVFGARGEIADGWKYDAYLMEGQTQYANFGSGNFSKSALTNALNVVPGPGGTAVCASGATGCVPYNIWQAGGVTAAQLAYLQIPTLLTGNTEERVGDANITGDLGKYGVKLPWNNDGLVVNVGTQWRSEHATLHPDAPQINNDVSGAGNAILPLDAGFTLWEGYFEAGLPILEDAPFAKELSFETGYRFSSYNLGFNTNTYKFGVNYAPTSDARFRASYQRAVRAPNIQELFQQKVVALDGSANGDPCATSSGSPPTATAAQCARTGVTAAQYGHVPGNPAGQYQGLVGGNPQLKPEQADTVSAGFVLTPTMVPNLTMSLDYFHIKVKNVITSTGFAYQLNQCLTNDLYCSSIHRDPTGSLWIAPTGYIDDITLNLGGLTTQGADVTAGYKYDLDAAGKLDFTFIGTYTAQLITQVTAGGPSYDCAGYFGNTCGPPVPKFKAKTRITYETPLQGLGVSAQWRTISSVQNDQLSPNQLLNGTPAQVFSRIPSFQYLDLSASYAVNKTVSLLVGVNNVLDKDPPQLTSDFFPTAFVNGNTYVGTYDSLGRFMFANITLNF